MTKTMAQEITDLHALDVAALVVRFEELFGKPPRSRNRAWLLKRTAHQIQVARSGGLSEVARKRLAELMAEIDVPLADAQTMTGQIASGPKRDGPVLGTTFTRTYRGSEVRVTVVDGGFDYGGVVHKSLSAAVRAITGAKWNPSIFFGLKARKPA